MSIYQPAFTAVLMLDIYIYINVIITIIVVTCDANDHQLPPGSGVDEPFTLVARKFYDKYEEKRHALAGLA